MGVPQARWLVSFMENPHLEIDDDLGVALWLRTPPFIGRINHEFYGGCVHDLPMKFRSESAIRQDANMEPEIPPFVAGWWFESLWKILVNWDDYSQYMGKYKMFQTTNQVDILHSYQTPISWGIYHIDSEVFLRIPEANLKRLKLGSKHRNLWLDDHDRLVVGWATPLKNDGVRQLGWWDSQYFWENLKNGNHSPPTRWPIESPWLLGDIFSESHETWERSLNCGYPPIPSGMPIAHCNKQVYWLGTLNGYTFFGSQEKKQRKTTSQQPNISNMCISLLFFL